METMVSKPRAGSGALRVLALAGVASAVVAFYFWTAATGQARYLYPQGVQDYDFYNQLSDGFRDGHLYMKVMPKPELLALPDPYDPAANEQFRLHDASLYRGHYYMYWGPAPALTLYLPYYLVTGSHLPENFGVAVFGALGFLASCLLFFALWKRLHLAAPFWMRALFLAVLGICQFVPWNLRRAIFYECAILAGMLFVMLGFYFWLRALEAAGAPRHLLAAGLCFGLAAGSRPQLALLAVAFVGVSAFGGWLRERSWRALVGPGVLAAAIPVAVCGLGLCWYNWARFGSPAEFGVAYQLSTTRLEGVRPTWGKFLAGLYYYLIGPLRWHDVFPFVELPYSGVFGKWMPKGQYLESVAGLFTTMPVYLLGFFLPLFPSWRRLARASNLRTMVWGLWGAGMLAFLIICPLGWAILRYATDFAPEFLILSLLAAALLTARIEAPRTRSCARAVLAAVCGYGMVVNILLSFAGCANGLEAYDPPTYERLAQAFAKLGVGQRCVSAMEYEALVTFPVQPAAGSRIVVLRTGAEPHINTVALEFVSSDRVRVRYEEGSAPAVWTADRAASGGARYHVRIVYRDAGRRLSVAMNGTEVFSARALWYSGAAVRRDREVQPVKVAIERADSCTFVPENFDLPGCQRGICQADGKTAEVVFWGNAGREGLAPGDTLHFAGAGSARIVAVRQVGELCFLKVNRELDPERDGYPHPIGRPTL